MIATATHTTTKLTRLVDVLETTPERVSVSWTLGTRVEFDSATGRGLGRVRDWILNRTTDDPSEDIVRHVKRRPSTPTEGCVRLRAWLADNNVSQCEFARRLGKEPSTVNKWVNLLVTPTPAALRKITRITGIQAKDFHHE